VGSLARPSLDVLYVAKEPLGEAIAERGCSLLKKNSHHPPTLEMPSAPKDGDALSIPLFEQFCHGALCMSGGQRGI